MLVTFRTKAHASITMFGDIAEDLLKKMGQSGDVPGAILAEDIPLAIDTLKKTIGNENTKNIESNAWDDNSVSTSNRASPLIELLQAAADEECNVMWEKAGAMEPGITL